MDKSKLAVGDKVRLTGKFLRSTGQGVGNEGRKTWTVTGLSGPFVTTDEKHPESYVSQMWTPEEVATDPTLCYRKINAANLFKVGTVSADNC
jgi:hypothetical protein